MVIYCQSFKNCLKKFFRFPFDEHESLPSTPYLQLTKTSSLFDQYWRNINFYQINYWNEIFGNDVSFCILLNDDLIHNYIKSNLFETLTGNSHIRVNRIILRTLMLNIKLFYLFHWNLEKIEANFFYIKWDVLQIVTMEKLLYTMLYTEFSKYFTNQYYSLYQKNAHQSTIKIMLIKASSK